jgi:GH18 family chitinase
MTDILEHSPLSYARYFPMSECSGGNQLDCALDSTFPEQSASSMRFDKLKNAEPNKCDQDSGLGPWDTKECGDAAQKEQKRTALGRFRTANKSFEKNVLPMQGTSKSKTYDDIAMADSLYDKESKLFWTWQSPYAITQTCEAIKKDTTIPIGGQFVYAIGQDSADLVHMKAFQDCVKEWK